jgi:hypothetical protein
MAYLMSHTAKRTIILGNPASGNPARGKTRLARRSARAPPAFVELAGPRFVFPSDVRDAFDALLSALQSSPL